MLITAHEVADNFSADGILRLSALVSALRSPRPRGSPPAAQLYRREALMARELGDMLYRLATSIELAAATADQMTERGATPAEIDKDELVAHGREAEKRVRRIFLQFPAPEFVRKKRVHPPRFRRFCLVESVMRAADYVASRDADPSLCTAPAPGPDGAALVVSDLAELDPEFAKTLEGRVGALEVALAACVSEPTEEHQWPALAELCLAVFGEKVAADSLKADVTAIRKVGDLLSGGRGAGAVHWGISWALKFGTAG
ncbi:MAG: hypothetical protein FJ104_08895 [Deltaproteobacteria bacterium]|nr:hypothetical protein [Deltaproteobacteria bacterium]